MTDRLTIDQINSDQLDQLYYRLDQTRNAATLHRQGLITTAELYAAIEADPEPSPAATQATEPDTTDGDDEAGYAMPDPPIGCLLPEPTHRQNALSGPQGGPEAPDAGAETTEAVSGAQTGADGFGGPSIADCKAADARWPLEKEGS